MKLEKFRVQNYKKVRDTSWVTVRDLTAFVGKNESGKSAIFRGLSKLNPSDGERYDGLKEFPRRRFTDEFKTREWLVASGRFALEQNEREELAGMGGRVGGDHRDPAAAPRGAAIHLPTLLHRATILRRLAEHRSLRL